MQLVPKLGTGSKVNEKAVLGLLLVYSYITCLSSMLYVCYNFYMPKQQYAERFSMPIIKERLHDMRKQNNLTAKAVGECIGVGQDVISKYEKGIITKLDTDRVLQLAQAVNCDFAYLMGWQDSPICEDLKVDSIERNFVENLRLLNADGQEKLQEYLEVMIASQKFNK